MQHLQAEIDLAVQRLRALFDDGLKDERND